MSRRRNRIVAAAACAVAAVLVSAVPADAGGSGRIKARIAKHSDGPYVEQVLKILESGQSKRFYIKVKNNTPDQPFDVNMVYGTADADYKVKYFRFDGTNITAAVTDTGYEFHLEPQQVRRFQLKIKAVADTPGSHCAYTDLEELGGGPGDDQVRVGLGGSDCD